MTPADFCMARRLLGLSQEALAARLGYGGTGQVKQNIVSRWERGERPIPRMAAELVALWALDAMKKARRRARREINTRAGERE